MKALIVYLSKTGFTKRYAQWLKEDLSCDCVPFDQRGQVDLSPYGAVVFGSSVHAGRIRKLGWLKKQLPALAGKRVGRSELPGHGASGQVDDGGLSEDARLQKGPHSPGPAGRPDGSRLLRQDGPGLSQAPGGLSDPGMTKKEAAPPRHSLFFACSFLIIPHHRDNLPQYGGMV